MNPTLWKTNESDSVCIGYNAGFYSDGVSNVFLYSENQASTKALFDAQSKAYQEIQERYHTSHLNPQASLQTPDWIEFVVKLFLVYLALSAVQLIFNSKDK